jgi:hypothetical protein
MVSHLRDRENGARMAWIPMADPRKIRTQPISHLLFYPWRSLPKPTTIMQSSWVSCA